MGLTIDPNWSGKELDLLKVLASELSFSFEKFQSTSFFIKLEQTHEKLDSKVAWVREFPDIYEMIDFFFDTIYQRACIMIKFDEGRYKLLIWGFQISGDGEVESGKDPSFDLGPAILDREKSKLIRRELLQGFNDFSRALIQSKGNKAI